MCDIQNKKTPAEKISMLQSRMEDCGMDVYIICTEDFHGSEYVGDYFKAREYLSGFTGSAGVLLVLAEPLRAVLALAEPFWEGAADGGSVPSALLWTDGRYFLQAETELSGTGIMLMRTGQEGVPKLEEYLERLFAARQSALNCPSLDMPGNAPVRDCKRFSDRMTVGFDGRTVSVDFADRIARALSDRVIFRYEYDLVGQIWQGRPALPAEPVWELDEKYTGMLRAEKLKRVRDEMKALEADHFVISALDDIAWLLNLRGNDVKCNPVFLSYLLLGMESAVLYVNRDILSRKITEKLAEDHILVKPYDAVYGDLQGLPAGTRLLLDAKQVNYTILKSVSDRAQIINATDPIVMMKAVKTKAEIENMRRAHIKDGVAVTRFMYWLKQEMKKKAEGCSSASVTELGAAEKLEEFRRDQAGYLGASFDSIMAYGAHGAIVHYAATKESNAVLEPRSFLLSDTGGHYYEGTTDITRTYGLGALTPEEKKAYTLVLAGHLELANAKFLYGVRGTQLDILARTPLWREGLDFLHGTGHGVGYLLNVHEGPNAFRHRIPNGAPDGSPCGDGITKSSFGAVLEEGMITSDEPGLYFADRFGVRLENLILCKKAEKNEYGQFLCFENLTMAPFDWDAVNVQYLSDRQLAMLNAYHQKVYEAVSPHLPEAESKWLREITAAREKIG